MKLILTTKKQEILVDEQDYKNIPMLANMKWMISTNGYAICKKYDKLIHKYSIFRMHRLVMNALIGYDVDHIDGNKLNNQKANLRICTRSENARNKKMSKSNTSGYKGVCWFKEREKWMVKISPNGKSITVGYFDNLKEAARAYNAKAVELFGEFALLNKI